MPRQRASAAERPERITNAPEVRVCLLGGLSVEIDGIAVSDAAWARRHGAGLVALLALSPDRRLHREQVIDALWPDLSVADAAPRLHKAAHHARRALGTPDSVVLRAENVLLFPDATVTVDTVEFTLAADAAGREGTAVAAEHALSFHRGDLLPELPYDEWTDAPRERIRATHVQLLRQAGRWEALVEHDPTDELAHVALMRALLDRGAPHAALAHYDRMVAILERELGAEPGPLRALDLRDQIITATDAPTIDLTDAPRRHGHLPLPTDAFLGRDADLDALSAAVERSRIVTLFGAGGVGKTRLAIEYARTRSGDCVFVDLTCAGRADAVPATILDAIGASTRSGVPDAERVVEALEARAVLLVLDNCEHVVDGAADMVDRLARETAAVRLVTTSREALGVSDEMIVPIAPLGLPVADDPVSEQERADAVRLFRDRATRAGGNDDDLASVTQLVRRLDGIPLALELAAARSRTFSAAQILDQLDAGMSVRAPRRSRGPAHHVSLEDTIDWSFQLLDADEQALLLRLSTFQGSFDLDAVVAVADVVPIRAADLLSRLVDKSLVQSSVGRAGRRLRLLDTVRRFAAARIDADAAAITRDRHARHFAELVATLGAEVPGPTEDLALARLAVALDDITAAFAHAVAAHDIDTAARLVDGPRLSLSAEGARWAHLALRAAVIPEMADDPRYVSILASAAWGAVLRGDLTLARELAQKGLDLAGDPSRHPRLCWIWPQATGESFPVGVACCLEGARIASEAGDHAAESFLLATAAIYRMVIGDEAAAAESAERALELARALQSRSLRARAAGALAYALQDVDVAGARRAAAEVLEVAAPGDLHLSMPHRVLGTLAWRDGDAATASEHAARASELIRDQGDRYVQAAAMRQLAVLVGDVDSPLTAELLGVADGIVPGIPVIARDVVAVAALEVRLRDELGEDGMSMWVQRGRRADARAAFGVTTRGILALRQGRRGD